MTAPRLGPKIRERLGALRRTVRLALLGRGGARLVVVAVLCALISYALDRPLRLEWTPRLALWLTGITWLGVEAWRFVLQPGVRPLPEVELARAYERSHPQLGWRLLSAVQFAAGERSEATSAELAAEVVSDVEGVAPELTPGAAVPFQPVLKRLALAGLALALAGVLARGYPQEARTWAYRNLLLRDDVHWPQDTYLQLVSLNGQPVDLGAQPWPVAQGSDLELVVGVKSGVTPKRVYLLCEGLRGAEEPIPFDDLGHGQFRVLIQRLPQSFSFHVEGNDERLGPFEVKAVEPPWLEAVELTVEPPSYTGKPAQQLTLESGNLSFPVGTKLVLRARASKALVRAWVDRTQSGKEERLAGTLEGEVQQGAKSFTVSWTLEETGQYRLGLIDADGAGLGAPPRFGVVAVVDRAPSARLELSGVGLNVTPEATFGFLAGAEDDYGLSEGTLRIRPSGRPAPPAKKEGEGEQKEREGEEKKAPEAPRPDDRERVIALEGFSGKRAEAEGSQPLAELKLVPRMALTLWVEARDGDPRGKKAGSSPSLQLRVVSPEQLLNELLRRLYEERQQLERMARDEDDLARELASQGEEALRRGPATQRDVAKVVARAAEHVERVVVEMISNQILDQTNWNRLREQVVAALEGVGSEELTRALQAAEAAQVAQASEPEALPQLSQDAADAARAVALRLREIVERMGRIEELAEVVAQLKRIIRKQRELLDKTRKERGQ